jgi:hypothetical protein
MKILLIIIKIKIGSAFDCWRCVQGQCSLIMTHVSQPSSTSSLGPSQQNFALADLPREGSPQVRTAAEELVQERDDATPSLTNSSGSASRGDEPPLPLGPPHRPDPLMRDEMHVGVEIEALAATRRSGG